MKKSINTNQSCLKGSCPKGGVKIHETPSQNTNNFDYEQQQLEFFNKIKNQNKHTGVRIENSDNNYSADPFAGFDPFKHGETNDIDNSKNHNHTISLNPVDRLNKIDKTNKTNEIELDLNIDNYSREDLYSLFNIKNKILNENTLKEAKKIVLKMHPDKSQLDQKYFIFFSTAFKRLFSIYEFQNKNKKNEENIKSSYNWDNDKTIILDNIFDNSGLGLNSKKPSDFNSWFNEQFNKHKLTDENAEKGYDEWLKSDEDIIYTPQNVNKDTMAREIEKRKKQVQTLTVYNGVSDNYAPMTSGSSLMEYGSNFTSGTLFNGDGSGLGYTDLKQAYVESVIPVTEDDYNKIQKFKSVDEYKRHREREQMNPLSKEEAVRRLYNENKKADEESAALAFYYAQQEERNKRNQESFWSGLKQISNW